MSRHNGTTSRVKADKRRRARARRREPPVTTQVVTAPLRPKRNP
jgi:hypothetical protein